MGSRLFLPVGGRNKPYPFPQTEREELLNRLWETRTLMPEARTIEIAALRDYVQAQEEKTRQGHYEKVAPAKRDKPNEGKEYENAVEALKEFAAWRNKRMRGDVFMGQIP